MQSAKKRRKRFFINPPFQRKVILNFAFLSLSTLTAFFVANRYFFWKFQQKGVEMGIPPTHIFYKFLAEQKVSLDYIYFIVALLAFIVSVFYGLVFSHRISGPIYKIQKFVENDMEPDGQTDLALRQKDDFKELVYALNDMRKRLKKRE